MGRVLKMHGVAGIGGYSDPNQLDCQGMYPALHAIDQSVSSLRAAFAALELIPITDPELLNKRIECEARFLPVLPVGYCAAHLCASGVDYNKQRVNIMKLLIERKADVNKKTVYKPHNTPATLASSQGCPEVLQLLEDAGADMSATNYNGLGLHQGAQLCSRTRKEWCVQAKVPELHTTISGRTRGNYKNDSRMLRYAQLSSYNHRQEANEWRHSGWDDRGDHGSQPSGYDRDAWQHEHSGWNDHGSQRSAYDHDAKQHTHQANWNDHGSQPSRYHRDAHNRESSDHRNWTHASQSSGSQQREARHGSQTSGYHRDSRQDERHPPKFRERRSGSGNAQYGREHQPAARLAGTRVRLTEAKVRLGFCK